MLRRHLLTREGRTAAAGTRTFVLVNRGQLAQKGALPYCGEPIYLHGDKSLIPLRTLAALLGLAAATSLVPAATAQQFYPSRPVTIVVPFPAGGVPDMLSRIVAERVAANWGVPVVVESRAGAGGAIGAAHVARSAADGYTLLLATLSHVTNPGLVGKSNWHPSRDFAGVVELGTVPVVAVVPSSLPVRSLRQFVDYARQRPGRLNYLMPGAGTSMHLNTEMLKLNGGIQVEPIPYKGVPAGLPDLLTGRLSFSMSPVQTVRGAVEKGALRAIAVASPRRVADLPDVPTFTEAGFPDVQVVSWYALIAPAGTPTAVRQRLNEEFSKALADPSVRERLAQAGALSADPSSPEQVDAMLRRETARWEQVLGKMNIRK
jgi:tripartite-type tricarboxylate transporter receptor subunit TctC